MIKKATLVLALLFSLNFYAQIEFEKAYFIDNNNVKTECLIKNFDWRNNPLNFEYKKNEEETAVHTKTVNEVKEFSIEEGNRYISEQVAIDTSSVDIRSYSNRLEPDWAQKKLFLKEIITGDYSLYEYVNGNMKRYFFKPKDGNIEQLVYKKYMINYTDVKENNAYRRQLLKDKPESVKMERIAKITYNLKSLTTYFLEINNMDGKKVVVRNNFSENLKDKFLFNFKAGANFSSLSIERNPQSPINPNVSFENKNTIKVGFEVEYVFPFNKNKWAIYFEPSYQTKYQSETKVTRVTPGGWTYPPETWSASYNALDLNFGLRYYMFLSPKSKLFANLGYVFCPTINKELRNVTENHKYSIVPSSKFIIGLGYNYNKKYSLEARYGSTDILDDYGGTIMSKFKTFSFVLGYTIFETNKK